MIVLRILLNGLIMAAEIAAVVAIAFAGYQHPFAFAAVTAFLTFMLGLRLEAARLSATSCRSISAAASRARSSSCPSSALSRRH